MPTAKPLSERAYRAHISIPPELETKARRLAAKRKLSAVCEQAVREAKL
ncbi:hypothetical protein M0R72_07245 [Candidatus Pacearchaeota archaeon]|jgi:hypothetical protein|nr:hypothetical protein [Candidatus Pacearchaeota archaeon]